MAQVFADISISLDGFVAGPNPTLDEPLGKGGEGLHEWALATKAWREPHGREGGEENVDGDILARAFERSGATVMGRRMFSGGEGPWEDDPNPDAWWGDEPPFHHPVFVVTHHEREPLEKTGTTFTFVTDGVESAVEQALEAAGGKDVGVGGGGTIIQQARKAGVLDELNLHVVPVLLGGGAPLFGDHVSDPPRGLERTDVVSSPTGVVHLSYRAR
jgi:dihydrofolate reductase